MRHKVAIPTQSRVRVTKRDGKKCWRCGMNGEAYHHRRSRSVRDEHTHCTCNGVTLCTTCHEWVHAHPFEAKTVGLIVSRHKEPSRVPMDTSTYGPVLLNCDGSVHLTIEEES